MATAPLNSTDRVMQRSSRSVVHRQTNQTDKPNRQND